jgi:hypothetical protein
MFVITSVFFREYLLCVVYVMCVGAGDGEAGYMLPGVVNTCGAMVCRPNVDPSLLIHRDPRAWEELLGWRCVEAIMRKMKLLGVGDLYSLVDFFFEYPQSSPDLLHGINFEGERGEEWRKYVERRRLSLGARMKFPHIDAREELPGVRIRLSPAALLLPFDRYRETWRTNAPTLYRAAGGVIPTRAHPHYYLSQLFPRELRALAARGYVWVANTKSEGRRNHALAEWLYWLDHARMPHIDLMLGKFVPRSPLDKVIKDAVGRPAGCTQKRRTVDVYTMAAVSGVCIYNRKGA